MKIRINNVRLAFPQLFEANTVVGEGKPAFSASFIIPRDHPQIAHIKQALAATAEAKWGAKGESTLKALLASDKVALHNGDTKSNYQGFEGNYYISARNPVRPLCVGPDKAPLAQSDGKLYAGCYVNVILEFWAQDNAYGKRINATLMGVQFHADGDAFSGGGAASVDDFDAVDGAQAADFF